MSQASLLPIGTRVRMTSSGIASWSDQSKGTEGTVILHLDANWMRVSWDCGCTQSYLMRDIEPADVCPEDMTFQLPEGLTIAIPELQAEPACQCPLSIAGIFHNKTCAHWKPANERDAERYRLENTWAIPKPKPAEDVRTMSDKRKVRLYAK